MAVIEILRSVGWRDMVDIIFLTLVAYQLFVWFQGTKALRVLIGLVVLGGVYSLAKFWGLMMTTWAFQILWQVLVILLLILFQSEIRQVLEKVSPLRYLRAKREKSETAVVDELASVVFDLAGTRTGAIIVLAREDRMTEFLHAGQTVQAVPTSALIKSIFNTQAPAHDGAVIIENGRLTEMGAFLPLTEREDLPESYGTRHRAAVGLCEKADCVCLVVSEERGQVTSILGRDIRIWDNPESLKGQLREWLGLTETNGPTFKGFLKSAFVENWSVKIGSFVLIALAWLVVASTQNLTMTLRTPVVYLGTPAGMIVEEGSERQVNVIISGSRRWIAHLQQSGLKAQVDLTGQTPGEHLVRVTHKDIEAPLGLTIERVTPQNIVVILRPADKSPSAGTSLP